MNSKAKVVAEAQVGNDGDRRFTFTLNDDLSLEILLWLPAKSVFRFKSVCKHWLSIPSSADFCRIHTLNYPKQPKVRPSLLLKASDSNFFYFNPFMNVEKPLIPYTFSVPNPIVISSCNGLMLLQSHHTDKSFHHTDKSFHVYNPTTKQAREISVIDTRTDNEPFIVDLSLAFDPSESPHYKVVCVRSTTEAGTDPNENHTYQIEVYDSESRTWSLKLGPFTFPQVLFVNGDGVYWNGAIYWLIYNEIGYYDIGKSKFDTIALPTHSPIVSLGLVWTTTHSLQEANGRLYHTRVITRGDWQAIELFELDTGDRSSWLLKYDETISDHEPTGSFHSHAHQLRFITETCSVLSHMSGKISVHSFLDYSSKLLVDLSDQPYYQEDCEMEIYEFGQCLALV